MATIEIALLAHDIFVIILTINRCKVEAGEGIFPPFSVFFTSGEKEEVEMRNRTLVTLGLLVFGFSLYFASGSSAGVLANSETDFSGTQGGNNWYYGYYSAPFTSSTFQQFPNYDPNFTTNEYDQYPTSFFGGPQGWYLKWGNSITGGSGGYWLSQWTNGGHPNGTTVNWDVTPTDYWSVRRWVSPVTGEISISGLIGSLNGGSMVTSVDVNGTQVFTGQPASLQTSSYSFDTAVTAGADVDFVIAPNNGDETNGATEFTATIATVVPEPSSFAVLGIVLVGLLMCNRRVRSLV